MPCASLKELILPSAPRQGNIVPRAAESASDPSPPLTGGICNCTVAHRRERWRGRGRGGEGPPGGAVLPLQDISLKRALVCPQVVSAQPLRKPSPRDVNAGAGAGYGGLFVRRRNEELGGGQGLMMEGLE